MEQSIECATSSIATRLQHPERQQLVLKNKHFKRIDLARLNVNSQYVQDRRLSKPDVVANPASANRSQAAPPQILTPVALARQTSHKRIPTANSFFVGGEVSSVGWDGNPIERRASSPDARLMRLSGDTVLYAFRERRGLSQT